MDVDCKEMTLIQYQNGYKILQSFFVDLTQSLEISIKLAFDKTHAKVICVGKITPELVQALDQLKIDMIKIDHP